MATATAGRNPTDRNVDATIHIRQLDDKVTDAILYELMIQAAPVKRIYIPRDRITGNHYGYGFCEFNEVRDARYTAKVFNMVRLFGKAIRISQSTGDRRTLEVGANIFVGNLVDEVDEKLLHDAFSAFGPLIDAPYIVRDTQSSDSRHYGFIKYGSFEHSDAAIAAMNGQYICNSPITVQYAYKKDGKSGERHGSEAERILAAQAVQARRTAGQVDLRPHTLFSDRPASAQKPHPHHPMHMGAYQMPHVPMPGGPMQPQYPHFQAPYPPPGGVPHPYPHAPMHHQPYHHPGMTQMNYGGMNPGMPPYPHSGGRHVPYHKTTPANPSDQAEQASNFPGWNGDRGHKR